MRARHPPQVASTLRYSWPARYGRVDVGSTQQLAAGRYFGEMDVLLLRRISCERELVARLGQVEACVGGVLICRGRRVYNLYDRSAFAARDTPKKAHFFLHTHDNIDDADTVTVVHTVRARTVTATKLTTNASCLVDPAPQTYRPPHVLSRTIERRRKMWRRREIGNCSDQVGINEGFLPGASDSQVIPCVIEETVSADHALHFQRSMRPVLNRVHLIELNPIWVIPHGVCPTAPGVATQSWENRRQTVALLCQFGSADVITKNRNDGRDST